MVADGRKRKKEKRKPFPIRNYSCVQVFLLDQHVATACGKMCVGAKN